MTVSTYMPDVQVEVAFNAGYSTPAASRTWTDVSAYVELDQGISLSEGRGDEFSVCDANTLSLTLDNSDGRFTPGRTASPYYPNVLIGRPIRVRVTPVTGTVATEFLGYVDEWPLEWQGVSTDAVCRITASSRLARLGLSTSLLSPVGQEIMADDPLLYYPLGEAEGATRVADASGNGGPALVLSGSGVAMGGATGPGTDDLSAPQWTATVALPAGTLRSAWANGAVTTATFAVFFSSTGGLFWPWRLQLRDAFETFAARIDGSGLSTLGVIDSVILPELADGATHHLAGDVNVDTGFSAGGLAFVDGVEQAFGWGDTEDLWGAPLTLRLGGLTSSSGTQTAALAHFAVFPTRLSAARIASHAAAGLTGWEGDLPGARLARYAAWAGIAAAETSLATGTVPLLHIQSEGRTVLDVMRDVETTEGGVLFDAPDGTLTFHARSQRYAASTVITLDAALHEVEADYASRYDRSALVNMAEAQTTGGAVVALVTDTASRDEYGVAATSVELATTDPLEPHARASWIVGNQSQPSARVPTLSVDLLPFSAARQALLLGLTVGSRIGVSGLPSQAAATTADYFVEGVSAEIGPESYRLTFNVSPAAPTVNVWRLGVAGFSELGTTTRLAY